MTLLNSYRFSLDDLVMCLILMGSGAAFSILFTMQQEGSVPYVVLLSATIISMYY